MELSQASLAMLLLAGMPVGVILHFIYALSDINIMSEGLLKKLFGNLKDFFFTTIVGIAAILMVYFVNNGEFRYMILVGIVSGYVVSHLVFHKAIVASRNAIIRLITTPLVWFFTNTFGKVFEKARAKERKKQTILRIEQLMQLASNGFEN